MADQTATPKAKTSAKPKRPVDVRVDVAAENLRRAQEAQVATTATETAAAKEGPMPILSVDRLKGAEYERIVHVATPGAGHTRADMLRPAYWSHVSPKLKPYDRVEVRAEDGTYFAELLVLACDRTWARMYALSWHELSTADVSLTEAVSASSKFEVKHTPGLRWHVVRKSDRQVMMRDGQTRDEAETWVKEYVKTVPV